MSLPTCPTNRITAFLPAHDERKAIARIVKRIENGKVALAGNGERVRRALGEKIGDEYFAAGAGKVHCATGRSAMRHSI